MINDRKVQNQKRKLSIPKNSTQIKTKFSQKNDESGDEKMQ